MVRPTYLSERCGGSEQGVREVNNISFLFVLFLQMTTKETRTVLQFHFVSWPDHGVPDYPTAIMSLRRRIRHYYDPNKPMVVHCRYTYSPPYRQWSHTHIYAQSNICEGGFFVQENCIFWFIYSPPQRFDQSCYIFSFSLFLKYMDFFIGDWSLNNGNNLENEYGVLLFSFSNYRMQQDFPHS